MSEDKKQKLLEVKNLHVSFFTPAGEVKAVNGISYDVDYDEVMGIVGESGSGKSVEAYSIIGLLQSPGKVMEGSITLEGEDMLAKSPSEMINYRGSQVAMIFQNPMTCLNPVYTIGNQLTEALRAHDKSISKEEADKRAMEMLEQVGINYRCCVWVHIRILWWCSGCSYAAYRRNDLFHSGDADYSAFIRHIEAGTGTVPEFR